MLDRVNFSFPQSTILNKKNVLSYQMKVLFFIHSLKFNSKVVFLNVYLFSKLFILVKNIYWSNNIVLVKKKGNHLTLYFYTVSSPSALKLMRL